MKTKKEVIKQTKGGIENVSKLTIDSLFHVSITAQNVHYLELNVLKTIAYIREQRVLFALSKCAAKRSK
jgi:hypothetical protein